MERRREFLLTQIKSSTGGFFAYCYVAGFPQLRVRITRKLADQLNGLDLSRVRVGDVLELSERDAAMLIREGWAERVGD